MIKFEKPANLNGSELVTELKAAGVKVSDMPLIDGNGDFWLNIDAKDESKASLIVQVHDGTIIAVEPTITEKLASVGLSIDELKTALLT